MSADLMAKCKNCGKPAGSHNAKDKACPMGRKDRTNGYPYFSRETKFEPKKDPT